MMGVGTELCERLLRGVRARSVKRGLRQLALYAAMLRAKQQAREASALVPRGGYAQCGSEEDPP